MHSLSIPNKHIPAMNDLDISKVSELESAVMDMPQVAINTQHLIHANMYARTILIPAGVMVTGALVKLATIFIVSGECTVFVGDQLIDLDGYNVLSASAGRKQAVIAITDTYITMIFHTDARTVALAESEFTDEVDLLFTSRGLGENVMAITGE